MYNGIAASGYDSQKRCFCSHHIQALGESIESSMNKKAKKILFSTYWKNGWIDSKDRVLSDECFEYAKSQGLMFDPLSISHDECIDAIDKMVSELSREQIAKGFLSSLISRRLDWRSSLSSYSIAKNIPKHTYTPVISGTSYTDGKPTSHSYTCGVCRCSGIVNLAT